MGERLQGIYRMAVNGGEREKISDTLCPYSLTLDYATRDLYWLDSCTYQLETSKIDGSNFQHIETDDDNYFSYGVSVHDGNVYWTQTGPTSYVDCYDMEAASQHRIYSVQNTVLQDIHIVDPSNQPSGKPIYEDLVLEVLSCTTMNNLFVSFPVAVLDMTDTCQQSCLHGNCIQGLCTCDPGWTGTACDTGETVCCHNFPFAPWPVSPLHKYFPLLPPLPSSPPV